MISRLTGVISFTSSLGALVATIGRHRALREDLTLLQECLKCRSCPELGLHVLLAYNLFQRRTRHMVANAMWCTCLEFMRLLDWQQIMKFAAVLVALTMLLTGCMRKPTPKSPPKEYIMRGEIKALDPQAHLATVAHEKIDGWMEAMTMEYPIKDQNEFAKLKVGETIEAKIIVSDLEYWIAEVKGAAAGPPTK